MSELLNLEMAVRPIIMKYKIKIYEVNVQSLYTGSRIEGFTCTSYKFISKKKAIKHAYDLAVEYAKDNGLPLKNHQNSKCLDIRSQDIRNIKRFYIDSEASEPKKILKVSNCYRWPDDGGYCDVEDDENKEYNGEWYGHSIEIFESEIDFGKDIICETSFSA